MSGVDGFSTAGASSASRYQLLHEIGTGSYGTVWRALDTTSREEVAIKEVDLDDVEDEIQEIQSEISVLCACHSPNIVQYFSSSIVPGTTRLRIAMELMDASAAELIDKEKGGSPLPEPCIAYILREALNALVYLHSEHRMHRDIKPANILLSTQGMVKVSDFGVAAQVGTTPGAKRRTFVGSPLYMAPEVIQQSPDLMSLSSGGDDGVGGGGGGSSPLRAGTAQRTPSPSPSKRTTGYDEAADIWSLGITAMEMALGEPPRHGVPSFRLLFVVTREPPPQLEGPFSAQFKDFVWQCLRKSPSDRPPAIDLLMHPFVLMAELPEELLARVAASAETRRRQAKAKAKAPPEDVGGRGADATKDKEVARLEPAGWDFGTVKAGTSGSVEVQKEQEDVEGAETGGPDASLYGTSIIHPVSSSSGAGEAITGHERASSSFSFGQTTRIIPDGTAAAAAGAVPLGAQESDEAVSLVYGGTIVSRVPPPPPSRLEIPSGPEDLFHAPQALVSGQGSSKAPPPAFLESPSGGLNFLPRTGHTADRTGEPVASGVPFIPPKRGDRPPRPSVYGQQGSGPRSRVAVVTALTGMLGYLEAIDSPSIAELQTTTAGKINELGTSEQEKTFDLGPLGNFLVGQWGDT